MKFWECAAPGCRSSAHGIGAARGLRAIGWYVGHGSPAGSQLYCPRHHPDGLAIAGHLAAGQQKRIADFS
jgi:hypothetical protein